MAFRQSGKARCAAVAVEPFADRTARRRPTVPNGGCSTPSCHGQLPLTEWAGSASALSKWQASGGGECTRSRVGILLRSRPLHARHLRDLEW